MVVRRHPVLGFVGGAIIGLGVGLLFVMFGVAPLGPIWLIAVMLFFAGIGLVYALVMPPPRPPPSASM